MDDLLTVERMLILALLFCMGARFISARINGHEVEIRGEEKPPEEQ